MPRFLTIHRTIVPASERARYLARAKERKELYRTKDCHFWIFEEAALQGAFIEFTEAADRKTLASAHAAVAATAAPTDRIVDPGRVYQEVELK